MKVKEKTWIRFRIYLVAGFFMAGMGVVLARAYQLQVLEKERLASIAVAGYRDTIKLPPKRGTIYDCDGHELAVSVQVGSIYAHPRVVKNKTLVARRLAPVIEVKEKKIRAQLESDRSFVWLRRRIPPETVKAVTDLGLVGIGSTTESRRYYPGREIASNLIGFAGHDNQGLEGLERKYDRLLKGPVHNLIQMRDALGRPFFVSAPVVDGRKMCDLVLTIDKDIQYKAQRSLEAAVRKARAKSGHCLILDPGTGEILALAVVPFFNPNVFGNYRPQEWRNRIVTDCYEPGSTIKAFLLAAALDSKTLSMQTRFYCEEGKFRVANHTIHDTKEYGSLSAADIVTVSSNIGAVKMGARVGYRRFCEYLRDFGFGQRTGVDLMGERQGFIRPAEEAREIDMANVFFGQGMSCTSIQLAAAMGVIANGGKLMRPYVVKTIKDQDGRSVREIRPQVIRRVLSSEVAARVRGVLETVVSDRGTAPMAAIAGYRVGGKTGTSQKIDPQTKRYSKRAYLSLFVGFVPVDDPKLVMLVAIDEPQGRTYGGLVAGPVFSEVGAWSLNHLRVKPELRMVKVEERIEDPAPRPPAPAPTALLQGDDGLPDFTGQPMREVMRRAGALGLQVVPLGTGIAFAQTPDPGSSLEDLASVNVIFRPPH